jgi:glycosyltransferase involved in cell wall biosynthesis
LGKYYKASDYWILNSGYEGLSHVLLEALAYQLPVIVSNVGGNPEVVEDKINGLLVEYNNKQQIIEAIKLLETQPELKQKIVQNTAKTLEKFSNQRMFKEYLELFR